MNEKKYLLVILCLFICIASIPQLGMAIAPPKEDRHPDYRLPAFSASASDHTLLLSYGGTLSSWGRNDSGQCGLPGDTPCVTEPNYISINADIKSVAAGGAHSLALDSSGNVWAWGDNTYGQLGRADVSDNFMPEKVEGLENIQQIAAGEYHSLALDKNGDVWAWGRNDYHQLGNEGENCAIPQKIDGLSGITRIATKYNHNLAVQGDSDLWGWGNNRFGQLGENNAMVENVGTPIPISFTEQASIIGIAVGRDHSLALIKTDEAQYVYGWGSNQQYQLGQDTLTIFFSPVCLMAGDAIFTGEYSTAVQLSSHSFYCGTGCVYNKTPIDSGSEGTPDGSGEAVKTLTDLAIPGELLALGNHHGLSYTEECLNLWGRNTWGQLLTDEESEHPSPVLRPFVEVTPSGCMFRNEAEEQLFQGVLNFVEFNTAEELNPKYFWLHDLSRNGVSEVHATDQRHFSFRINLTDVPNLYHKQVFRNVPFIVSYHAIKLNQNLRLGNWLKLHNIVIRITPDESIALGSEDGHKITAAIQEGEFISEDPADWELVGGSSEVSISSVTLKDEATAEIVLSGNSKNVYREDQEVRLRCKSTGYSDSMDYTTKTPVDLVSENSIPFYGQHRSTGGGRGVSGLPSNITVTASVKSGEVLVGTKVELKSGTANAKIYYTTDGSAPTVQSTLYQEPIEITEDMTVKFIAVSGSQKSTVQTVSYTVKRAKVTLKENPRNIRYIKAHGETKFYPDEPMPRYEILSALEQLFDIEDMEVQAQLTDVDEAHTELVNLFVGAQLIEGYPDNTFRGNQGITRAEFVRILSDILKPDAADRTAFSDITGHWCEADINSFAKLGLLKGYPDNTFRPDDIITRAEAVTVLNRIAEITPAPTQQYYFEDVSAEHWACDDIYAALEFSDEI